MENYFPAMLADQLCYSLPVNLIGLTSSEFGWPVVLLLGPFLKF